MCVYMSKICSWCQFSGDALFFCTKFRCSDNLVLCASLELHAFDSLIKRSAEHAWIVLIFTAVFSFLCLNFSLYVWASVCLCAFLGLLDKVCVCARMFMFVWFLAWMFLCKMFTTWGHTVGSALRYMNYHTVWKWYKRCD